jgi:hypothetical protein
MKYARSIFVSTGLVLLSVDRAFAFDFGFVRVPDWMDVYIGWLFAATCLGFAGLAVTKPRGVAFNQVANTQISPVANFFRFSTLIAFAILMLMIFVGMGLRRFAGG